MPDMSPHLLQVLQLVIFLSYNLGNNTEVIRFIRFGVIVMHKENIKAHILCLLCTESLISNDFFNTVALSHSSPSIKAKSRSINGSVTRSKTRDSTKSDMFEL